MFKNKWIRAVTLGVAALLVGILIVSRVAPAVSLRSYFAVERKLDEYLGLKPEGAA